MKVKNMLNKVLQWAKKEYKVKTRALALIPMMLMFVLIIPLAIVWVSRLDHMLGFEKFVYVPISQIIALLLISVGVFFCDMVS